jgi:galactose mutarotase-like enzyme
MPLIRSDNIIVEADRHGAELSSIKGPGGVEYLWQGDPAYWPHRSPVLFPIVGSLPGGAYEAGGSSYRLGNHGFARDRDFRLVSSAVDSLHFELVSDESSLAAYPFHFRLGIDYRVSGAVLRVGYTVRNEGDEPMRFSIGAHPAFRAPLEEGESREDYELVFERAETARRHTVTKGNLRSGETLPFLEGRDRVDLSAALFAPGAVVLTDHASRSVTLRSKKSGRFVRVSFAGFPYLGIWSASRKLQGAIGASAAGSEIFDAPFVCIEPWYGIAPIEGSSQALAEKEGCLDLAPGAVFDAAYEIEVGKGKA